MHKSITLALALAALSACATQPPPPAVEPTKFTAPSPPPAPRVVTKLVQVPAPTTPKDRGRKADPIKASIRAQYDSLEMPDPSKFRGKDLQYPYSADFWYRVFTEVGQQTLLRLEAGEVVRNVDEDSGGILWRTKVNYYGGDGSDRYATVSIKPIRPNQKSQFAIYTNRRKYDVRAESFREQPLGKSIKHVEVSWYYPEQEYENMKADLAAAEEMAEENKETIPGSGGGHGEDDVLPGCKNGDTYYRVSGSTVPWFPVPTPDGLPRVCDDGKMVRINFPATLGTIEGPSLWESEDYHGTNARLLQYRPIGSTYVVDNLPRVMLLRQGAAEVKIVRTRD